MAITKWILDPTHSELGFKVKHLMITNVSGAFKSFTATVETEDNDFSTAKVTLTAQMDSVYTSNEHRDAHLRNADFFEVEKYPELTFTSTKIEKTGSDTFNLYGDLTLKGITKPVTLQAEFNGITKDPWGGQRAGFTIHGKLNRNEWGVSFNGVMETGGLVLSEEVKINAEIQVVKQVESTVAQ